MVQYLRYNLLVSRVTMGMYKTDPKASKSKKMLFKFIRYISNSLMFIGLILSVVNIKKKEISDIDKMAVEIMTSVIFCSAFFRSNYFYFREDKLVKVVETINTTFKRHTSTGFEEKSLEKYDKITKIFVAIWSFSVFFTGQFMALLPLTVIHKVGRVLPLPLWHPYDWKISPYFELTYIIEVLMQWFMVFSYGNSDMFYSCTMIMVTAQFTLLGWELQNLVYTTLLKQGLPKPTVLQFRDHCKGIYEFPKPPENLGVSPEILKTISSPKFKRDLNDALIATVTHYQVILNAVEDMQEFFSPLLLPEMLFGISYCIFIMYAIAVTTDVSILATLVVYLMMYYAQIFCITFLGQRLFDESENLLNDAYEMPWYLCDESFKKMFNIMQTRLQIPVIMSAWKFFDMKLTTFVYAIKTSFSFLAFLRQVTEAEL